MPAPYTDVNTLSECQTTPGTFYQNAGEVWCNPFIGENPSNLTEVGS